MKKTIANKWVKVLRSGKYKQAKGQLRNSNDEFCCLGVLCDISGQGKWEDKSLHEEHEQIYFYTSETENCDAVLPKEVQKWAGMRSRNGEASNSKFLTNLNDFGHSFNQIADFIEKHWEEL